VSTCNSNTLTCGASGTCQPLTCNSMTACPQGTTCTNGQCR
jgi:hypothetical protein